MRSFGRRPSRAGWCVLGALIVGLLGAYFLWPEGRRFVDEAYATLTSDDRARIERWVGQFGSAGPLVILGAMLAQALVPVLPSIAVMVVAVLAYGPFLGGLLAWGGLLLAAALAYGIGRLLGATVVARMLGRDTEERVEGFVRRYGVLGVVAFRVAPALSDDAVSFVAGLAGMGFGPFMLASAAGILPLTILVAVLGQSIETLESGLLWISVASVVIFLVYVVLDSRAQSGKAGG